MLTLFKIHKSFGDVHVLNGVDLRLECGRIHTLKGGNGSGKTTLFNIITGFLKKQVLPDVSFEVGERGIVLLTGGNGSGKSTVLKTIYGLLKPWRPEGRIIFNGEDITALPTEAMIRRGIVYMPQKKNVFEDFTVEENLLTSASIYAGGGAHGFTAQS